MNSLQRSGNPISVIDLSNAWTNQWLGDSKTGHLLSQIGPVTTGNSILLLTIQKSGQPHTKFGYLGFSMSHVLPVGAQTAQPFLEKLNSGLGRVVDSRGDEGRMALVNPRLSGKLDPPSLLNYRDLYGEVPENLRDYLSRDALKLLNNISRDPNKREKLVEVSLGIAKTATTPAEKIPALELLAVSKEFPKDAVDIAQNMIQLHNRTTHDALHVLGMSFVAKNQPAVEPLLLKYLVSDDPHACFGSIGYLKTRISEPQIRSAIEKALQATPPPTFEKDIREELLK